MVKKTIGIIIQYGSNKDNMPAIPKSKKTVAKTGKLEKPGPAIKNEPTETEPLANPGLQSLLLDAVKDIFWAENHLVKTLPKMQKAATSGSLKKAIGDHIAVTKNQVARLEKVFELLDEKIQAKKCDAMEGLSKEGEGIIEDTEAGTPARDLGIILASQKVEHYEIATYTGLAKLASTLGMTEVADLLGQTLHEETEADATLGAIAEKDINYTSI